MGNERTTGSQGPTTGQQRAPRETPGGGLGAVRIWLLDGFRISVGSSRSIGEDEWRLKKAGSLLKLLALAPAHRLHREQAMDLLWPELDSGAAANNLHHALHIARRTLEPSAPAGAASGYLHLRGESLALSPAGPVWVDVEAFEEAATTARHALEPAAYRAAIDLYSGELLPQDRYEVWAEDRRAQLRGVYLSLLGIRALSFAYEAGVRIASGSDLLGPLQDRKARELEIKTAVLSPMESLVSATKTNASLFGMEDEIGTVEEGKLADLLVVDGNPLENIAVLQKKSNLKLIMKGGRAFMSELEKS